MSTPRFIGAAKEVTDVWTVLVGGTWVAADTVTLTVGNRSLVVTVGATVTTTSIATALVAAWNGDTSYAGDATFSDLGSNIPEFTEATASVSGSTFRIDANTAGVPIGFSATKSSTSGTVTVTNLVVATGPKFWNAAKNWNTGAIPVNGDIVWVDNYTGDICYGLAQGAVTLAELHETQSFTGTIGLPETNVDGGYPEYRLKRLTINATIEEVGAGTGTGSGRIRRDAGSVQTTVRVLNTGSPLDPNSYSYDWIGSNAANVVNPIGTSSSVGIAIYGGETATVATVSQSGGDLYTGVGVTLSGALTVSGGSWNINSLVDGSLTTTGGVVTIEGVANVDQLTVRGGQVTYNTSGTLGGNTVIEGAGAVDLGNKLSSVTVTNAITLRGQNCSVSDPNGRMATVTFALTGGATAAQLSLAPNKTITVS